MTFTPGTRMVSPQLPPVRLVSQGEDGRWLATNVRGILLTMSEAMMLDMGYQPDPDLRTREQKRAEYLTRTLARYKKAYIGQHYRDATVDDRVIVVTDCYFESVGECKTTSPVFLARMVSGKPTPNMRRHSLNDGTLVLRAGDLVSGRGFNRWSQTPALAAA